MFALPLRSHSESVQFNTVVVWCIHQCISGRVSDVFAFTFTFQSILVAIENANASLTHGGNDVMKRELLDEGG